ncbi:MAG: hypothetical protein KDD42_09135, partial [Bdellovibrionales bacterium]|nr:hypothetical protein [Bdellovibrionales bacterium]
STDRPDELNTLGERNLDILNQVVFTSFSLIKGDTTFKPPDFELRVAPAFVFNHAEASEVSVLRVDPARGTDRDTAHLGFQELFIDLHLANISERYDFISSRIGIQRFQSDFRGFVFADEAPGARLFGNWDNNKWQYNLAWFDLLQKDTNTLLNTTFDRRYQNVYVANLYRQDTFALGHTLSASILHSSDNAGAHKAHFDDNGFLRRPASIGDERPKNLETTYFGLTGDGHFDRLNTTTALYYVAGTESHNQISGVGTDVSAFMAALELSYDFDWLRFRTSAMWASGDDDPFDGDATGFDTIFDNPNFAGGDLSLWQRQGIPLIAGGEVFLTNRNSLVPNLRAGKEEGQANFVNPGLRLFNLGLDIEVTPKLKVISNASFLQFDDVAVLRVLRQDGSFSRDIGFDLSSGLLYRPWLNNNVQVRLGAATLLPGDGLKGLYGDERLYQIFSNLILEY